MHTLLSAHWGTIVPKKLHNNTYLVYGLAFFHSFLVIVPVIVPFFASKGLSLAEIFYLQAVYATTIVLLEAPSGYFADLFGRRTALVIGSVIHGLGYFVLNFTDSLMSLVIFEIVLGLATSLLSGADLAMLYDTQKALKNGKNISPGKSIANLGFIRSCAEGTGALLGGVLAMWSFDLMVLVQSIGAWACLLFAFFIIEPPYKTDGGGGKNIRISAILKHMLAGDPVLRRIVIAIPLYNLTTFLAAWLIQPYWEEQGISLAVFGVLWFLQSLTTAIANKVGFRIERKYGAIFALFCIGILPIVGHFGLALSQGWIGIAIGLTLFMCRGLNQVILVNALNRRVPSEFRATANSFTSFLFRFSFITIGPLVGYIAEVYGLKSIFTVLAFASIALFFFVMLPLVQQVKNANSEVVV